VLQSPAYAGSKNERKEGGKMQELNKCPKCGQLLIAHEEIIAMHGELYCSRNCAVHELADDLRRQHPLLKYNTLVDMAKAMYEDVSEVVRTDEVLSEDLQEVQIAVTYYKTITLPKTLSEEKAKEVAEKLWNDDIIRAEPEDCDDVRFDCALVKGKNSTHDMEG
jgi:hypothetical protein